MTQIQSSFTPCNSSVQSNNHTPKNFLSSIQNINLTSYFTLQPKLPYVTERPRCYSFGKWVMTEFFQLCEGWRITLVSMTTKKGQRQKKRLSKVFLTLKLIWWGNFSLSSVMVYLKHGHCYKIYNFRSFSLVDTVLSEFAAFENKMESWFACA